MPSRRSSQLGLILLSCVTFIPGQIQAAAFPPDTPPARQEKQTQEQFIAEVRKTFDQENFAALDETAAQARESKERFPGAEWKLFIFYRALTWPKPGAAASDSQWQDHLAQLDKWTKISPKSQTARIALAAAWVEYAKLARTSDRDWRAFDKEVGGKEYQKRLKQANIALDFDTKNFFSNLIYEAKGEIKRTPQTKMVSYCPHWYFVRLALEQGRAFDDWTRYNNIFAAGVALEPTYYYLYQTKAVDLLPQNHGVKGQWEGFAENSMKSIGGAEGDITYYMIVSHVRPRYVSADGHGDFFRDNNVWGQKIWDGYKQIEATYGTSKYRRNEMALLASTAQQYAVARILFDQIGEDWDERVWQRKAAFDGHKSLVLGKTATTQKNPPSNSTASLKATLSSTLTKYSKSQDIVIEALIENPAGQNANGSDQELSISALSLAISNVKNPKQETTLLPQANDPQGIDKVIKPGGSVRITYRVNFALPVGDYKVRMKTLNSNELVVRIVAVARKS